MIQAPRSNGKKANWRHENWVCNFTPWRSAVPINSRARSRRQIKSVAALFVCSSALAFSNQNRIADLAIKNRLPAIYTREDFADSGGLISYGPHQGGRLRRVAAMIDKILKGTKPADIPVEQPTKFELIINLKAAKQISLTIPPNVLARADKVIR